MPRAARPLTETQVRKAKPKSKTYKLFDGGGLFLEVPSVGNRRWRFKYRFEGKEKLLAFGLYPDLSLADAREARDDTRKIRSQRSRSELRSQISEVRERRRPIVPRSRRGMVREET